MNSVSYADRLKPLHIWILYFSGFALLSICVLAVATLRLTGQSLLNDHINDAGHVLVFAILTIIGYAAARYLRLSILPRFAVAIFLSASLGLGIEVLQHFIPHRTASVKDFARDVIGIGVGIFLIIGFSNTIAFKKFESIRRFTCLLFAAIFFLVGIKSVFYALGHYRARDQSLPVLMKAEQTWWSVFAVAQDLDFWCSPAPNDWPIEADASVLNLKFYPEKLSIFGLRDPYPDWSSKRVLKFSLLSRAPRPFDLHVRVHDRNDGDVNNHRYTGVFRIDPGFQLVQIPITDIESSTQSRMLDIRRIAGLTLFTRNMTHELHVLVNNICLE